MILYASQRGRSAELATHLLNGDTNEHVNVHEIKGFVSDNLPGALKEAQAVSRGTRCKQFLFSLSLNPPEYASVPIEDFEDAIEKIEKKLGLTDQPRIIVFHEKHGRRHCHCVWSRIGLKDEETLPHGEAPLTAIRMSHFKRKLMDVSRSLYLKYGWKMPKGMETGEKRSPFHLTREEYRQAVRLAEDPQSLKAIFKSAWEQSDSKATFISALEERGMLLARGDRRGYVAIDVKGGIYSLSRWIDIGTRELKARLGLPESLPDIEQAKAFLKSRVTDNLNRFIDDAKRQAKEVRLPLVQELRTMTLQHREDRRRLLEQQQKRWLEETLTRSGRLSQGVRGIWDRITGIYQETREQNETETKASLARDRRELEALIRTQLHERQDLEKTVRFYRNEQRREEERIRQEIAGYITTATEPSARAFERATSSQKIILAAELAEVEAKISVLTGDIASLQASLGNALLSDDMRDKIRHLIEDFMKALHLETMEEEASHTKENRKRKEKEEEYQAQLNEYIRYTVELKHRIEEQERQIKANKEFFAIICNMSYSLNGVPPWKITVMSPPEHLRLDEKAYVGTLRRQSNAELLETTFSRQQKTRPLHPETAVPQLRQDVLQVKEILRRAGHLPADDGKPEPAIAPKLPNTATIKFNAHMK